MTLAGRIKDERPELPVVLISGWVEDISPEDLEAAGIRHVLTKPFGRKEIAHLLKSVQIPVRS